MTHQTSLSEMIGKAHVIDTNRADTLAALDRFKMTTNLDATVIIQHQPGEVAKLPAFPQGVQ